MKYISFSLCRSCIVGHHDTTVDAKCPHYTYVIMTEGASQITSLTLVYSVVYSGGDKKTSKLRVTGLCAGNSLATGEFPAQRASNAENGSI